MRNYFTLGELDQEVLPKGGPFSVLPSMWLQETHLVRWVAHSHSLQSFEKPTPASSLELVS